MLDVRRLRLLRELAHRGTIIAVAQALAFTPSAVSQQLSALEREAGLPLLERSGRRVVLTPAGLNLVRHAEVVLEQLERAAAELAGTRQGLSGPLRIGTFPSAGRTMIPAALIALSQQHPGLEPMVCEIDPAGVADALRAGELEVALIHEYDFAASRPEPGLDTEALCTEAMYLASAAPLPPERLPDGALPDGALPEGPPAGAGPSAIGRYRDAPWITATPGTLCHQMTLHACRAAGFTPHTRHQVDDFTTTLALVAAGQGVALVPQLGLAGPLAGIALTRVPLQRRTSIAYRSGAGGHPAVTAFAAALRSAVPAELGAAAQEAANGRTMAAAIVSVRRKARLKNGMTRSS
jgi:DNA-binding transcriptional LysR family regulator